MLAALVQGTLFHPPEQRASKAGKPFVTATVRVKDGDKSQFVRVVAFSGTAQAELMRLRDGDSLSVQGLLKCELYTPEGGEPRISLSMVADQALALRLPSKARASRHAVESDPRSRQERIAGSWQSPVDGRNDDISFGVAA